MSQRAKLSFLAFTAVLLTSVSAHALERVTHQQIAQASEEEGSDAGEAPAEQGERPPRAKRGDGERPKRTQPERSEERSDERPAREEAVPGTAGEPEAPAQRREEPTQSDVEKAAPPPAKKARPPVEAPDDEPAAPKAEEPPESAPKDAERKSESERPRRKKDAAEPPAPKAEDLPSSPAPRDTTAPKDKDGAEVPRRRDRKAAEPAVPPASPPEVKDLKELKAERKQRKENGGRRVVIEEPDNRVIVKEGDKTIIRADETERFRRLGGKTRREQRNGLDISINISPGGVEIFTEMDDRGRPLRRYRRDRGGREVILFDNRDYYRRHRDGSFVDAIVDLPPPRVTIPRNSYIVDYDEASDRDVYDALSAPPIERLQRAYSLEEVRRSPTLRDHMRRIDLDVINFGFGAWDVSPGQYPALERVANAINRVIKRNPNEMFLIEGHTDAVGSDDDNLSLSDRRAETVAIILTEEFGVPPENIVTQGYGEQYLKINTQQAEVQNRRVAVRRITPLMSKSN